MRLVNTLPILALVIYLAGCATTKEQTKKNVYTFDYEGHSYQIVSINTLSGEGTNFLTLVDENGVNILNARDLNQDGTLDVILKGTLGLLEADIIYKNGIEQAKMSGNYNERSPHRSFELVRDDITYIIRSYFVNDFTVTNMFIILNQIDNTENILVDQQADGVLDRVEKGAMNLQAAQNFYTDLLNEGVKQGRIIHENQIYMVTDKSKFNDAYLSFLSRSN